MKIPKAVTNLLLAAAFIALIAGSSAVFADYGSKDDPLVTLSYLKDVFAGDIMEKVDRLIDERKTSLEQELDKKIDGLKASLNLYGSSESDSFVVVTLRAGQTIAGKAGTELLLREGSAVCAAAAAPGLADVTTGDSLNNGGAVQVNHLYMVTFDGRGMKATAAASVLVRGEYTAG